MDKQNTTTLERVVDMDYQEIILKIIVNGGDARSHAMEAIQFAKIGKIAEAREALIKANDNLGEAHKVQTHLIQEEAGGRSMEVTLLMVHAQDHLMNAITIKDMAQEFVDMYEKFLKQ
ncbi:PTS lactose/cellobiose transporter subunit IIA [Clostridium sp. WILCCON 0202]|uniref:PTS lactose/cellobiose transporter subunit IIA n=2 Tax=Candidatus Clostridium radicumherbarum TaxID=3381662 RepID=A0ABW8TSK0_9CLOT